MSNRSATGSEILTIWQTHKAARGQRYLDNANTDLLALLHEVDLELAVIPERDRSSVIRAYWSDLFDGEVTE